MTQLPSPSSSAVSGPEVVIHTAYRQDGDGAREIVVDGSENVARAATAVGARLVHLSTDVIFDGRKGAPYVEADAPSPCTEYGRAKAEAEERVLGAAPGTDRQDVADRRRAGPRAVEARDSPSRRRRRSRRRDPVAGSGRRPRGRAARAGSARCLRAAQRRRCRRRLPCRPGRARRRPPGRAELPRRPGGRSIARSTRSVPDRWCAPSSGACGRSCRAARA